MFEGVVRYHLFGGQSPVRYADDGKWITLGGSAKDGKKHVGGFPAQIDGDGNILASRVGGLQGKNVKDVKGHFDEERDGGKKDAGDTQPSPGKSMIEQHARAKERHPGMMVLLRRGDRFYTFGQDAEILNKVTGATLTSKDGEAMVGFPGSELSTSLGKLLKKKHRVAIDDEETGEPRSASDPALPKGDRENSGVREREVAALRKQVVGKQVVTQKRARHGEIGPNGETYPGGAFIATTDMPKQVKAKIEKSATGKVNVEPGKPYEVPQPGKMSIVDKLGGTVLNHRDGSINQKYLDHIKATPEERKDYAEIAEKWKNGERWVDVNDYPHLANITDAARMVVNGVGVPGAVMDKLPGEWKQHLEKYKSKDKSKDSPTTESVASAINALAASAPQQHTSATARGPRFGDSKVFIGHIADQWLKANPGRTRDEFNAALMDAHQKGLVQLSRADLVEAMHPEDVEASEVKHPGGFGEFHFVRHHRTGRVIRYSALFAGRTIAPALFGRG